MTVVSTRTEETPTEGTWVYVELRNDDPWRLTDVMGVIWSLDQTDSINPQFIAPSLEPGETASFEDFLYGVGGIEVPGIKVAVQGILQP